MCTSVEALQKFFENLSDRKTPENSTAAAVQADVEKKLDAEGL